jgi:hypothetical protein
MASDTMNAASLSNVLEARTLHVNESIVIVLPRWNEKHVLAKDEYAYLIINIDNKLK